MTDPILDRKKKITELKTEMLRLMKEAGVSPKHLETYKKRKEKDYTIPAWKVKLQEQLASKKSEPASSPGTGSVDGGTHASLAGITHVYRSDNRSPEDMADKYPGFTSSVAQNPDSMALLLKEIFQDVPKGVDDWMATWVAGSMMGEVPAVSTTTNPSGHGTAKKYMYKIRFPSGLTAKQPTEQVLGFVPRQQKTQTTGLYMSGDTAAGSDTVVLTYSGEILFLTPIPESWIEASKAYLGNDPWKPYPPA